MNNLEIAAYYFPQWHADPRNNKWHGHGWTEWELVKAAGPRYPGHRQPVEPAWGCFDESDPEWSAREIDLAARSGLTAFIYDYYWYEDGPFLNRALDEGFLHASNRQQMKFALMWANHDWHNWFPIRLSDNAWRDAMLIDGKVTAAGFARFTEKVIGEYFSQSNYLRVEGKPYFSIYNLGTFINGFEGLEGAVKALDGFRQAADESGYGGLHLNAVVGRFGKSSPIGEIIERLGIDSVASYNWIDHYPIHADTFPRGSYEKAMKANIAAWPGLAKEHGVPYIANVTTGWDSSPRCCPTDRYENRGYPWLPILEGNTPQAFAEALQAMKDYFAKEKPRLPMFTINAWNEWTEGAYLLPDKFDGTSRLEGLKRVFGSTRLAVTENA
ncbi:MAG: glycoside hydrolase family 99-like domain-containing protein [Burkholderiales bacterium]|nr:glycoside hydrolase family 99-like domain-containing protein [Burkholderiales bacterium]